MKKKKFRWSLPLFILFLVFPSVQIVMADDDDDEEEYKKHERYERVDDDWWEEDDHDHDDEHGKYERDNDDDWKDEEYEWHDDESNEDENRTRYQDNQEQQSYWNIWTRDTHHSLTENLPFQEAKEVKIELNGQINNFYMFPMNGQLLVSAEAMSNLFGIKYTFHKQSRILEVANDQDELIFRAGSNAAYENMIKTPMPTEAVYFEKSVFLPISVIANAFGYRVNWDGATETVTLQEF